MISEYRAQAPRAIGNLLDWGWAWLRQVSGDAAYENYLTSTRGAPTDENNLLTRPLSRVEFYLESLERRYSSASRCC